MHDELTTIEELHHRLQVIESAMAQFAESASQATTIVDVQIAAGILGQDLGGSDS